MLVTDDQVCVLGIIIQEVLQGIANAELAEGIQDELAFELLDLTREDYLAAATRAANRPKDRDHVRELGAWRKLKFPEP